jgi:hypothetical protein
MVKFSQVVEAGFPELWFKLQAIDLADMTKIRCVCLAGLHSFDETSLNSFSLRFHHFLIIYNGCFYTSFHMNRRAFTPSSPSKTI